MKLTFPKAATVLFVGAASAVFLAACGNMPPEYEPAEPVGAGEQCFSIERSYPTEAELGIYCLPGVDPADVQRGGTDLYSADLD